MGSAADRGTMAGFSLKAIDGKTMKKADLAGKVTVMSFFATWCVPCKQELSALEGLRKKYEGQGFLVVAVATTVAPRVAKKAPVENPFRPRSRRKRAVR